MHITDIDVQVVDTAAVGRLVKADSFVRLHALGVGVLLLDVWTTCLLLKHHVMKLLLLSSILLVLPLLLLFIDICCFLDKIFLINGLYIQIWL